MYLVFYLLKNLNHVIPYLHRLAAGTSSFICPNNGSPVNGNGVYKIRYADSPYPDNEESGYRERKGVSVNRTVGITGTECIDTGTP
jgi:hypothetical protein